MMRHVHTDAVKVAHHLGTAKQNPIWTAWRIATSSHIAVCGFSLVPCQTGIQLQRRQSSSALRGHCRETHLISNCPNGNTPTAQICGVDPIAARQWKAKHRSTYALGITSPPKCLQFHMCTNEYCSGEPTSLPHLRAVWRILTHNERRC